MASTNLPIRDTTQLIKIDTDRRLGHEWDEWDGEPLANGGDFTSPPRLFFLYGAIGLLLVATTSAAVLFLLAPRLALLAPWLPAVLTWTLGGLAFASLVWLGAMAVAYYAGVPLLPEHLAERGLLLRTLHLASWTGELLGVPRDRTGHASVLVYNRLVLARQRKVTSAELLILVPRCLSRQALDGVLDIAKRYDVAAFVATRGQLARRVIRERRPRAVVAVACERDLLSGIRDCAGKVPVLGLTMTLPNGPCRDAAIDLGKMEEFVRKYLA